ncbi:hypothetical protein AVDCRST_MAG92-4405 [uncultured Coleofasciculus sp.]|uniref:Uncharacterized protein n=1 Tax=uncultured Coleofasciculus sp. TaxID=1267456 RepID=A0A6J4JZE6_9CYAN|nr:hypothetical protein AVDCRST_MAG92-4405 [uncultured Coleofasciculus sp.]
MRCDRLSPFMTFYSSVIPLTTVAPKPQRRKMLEDEFQPVVRVDSEA